MRLAAVQAEVVLRMGIYVLALSECKPGNRGSVGGGGGHISNVMALRRKTKQTTTRMESESNQGTWRITGNCENTQVQPLLHGEPLLIQILFCQQSARDNGDL